MNFEFLKNSFITSGDFSLPGLVNSAIDIVLFIAAVMAVIYLIYSGILYITAAGNPDAAKKGQQGIINAVIGVVIIVLAYVVANSIANYVGDNV